MSTEPVLPATVLARTWSALAGSRVGAHLSRVKDMDPFDPYLLLHPELWPVIVAATTTSKDDIAVDAVPGALTRRFRAKSQAALHALSLPPHEAVSMAAGMEQLFIRVAEAFFAYAVCDMVDSFFATQSSLLIKEAVEYVRHRTERLLPADLKKENDRAEARSKFAGLRHKVSRKRAESSDSSGSDYELRAIRNAPTPSSTEAGSTAPGTKISARTQRRREFIATRRADAKNKAAPKVATAAPGNSPVSQKPPESAAKKQAERKSPSPKSPRRR